MDENVLGKCRACLSESECMLSLFEEYEHGLSLATILQSIISVELSEDDGLPQMLCDNCSVLVTQFYNFIVIYEDSDRQLRTLVCEDQEDTEENVENDKAEMMIATGEITVEVNCESLGPETEMMYVPLHAEDMVNGVQNEDENINGILEYEEDNTELETNCKEELQVFAASENDETSQMSVEDYLPPAEDEDQDYETVTKYECNQCGEAHLFSTSFQTHMRVKHDEPDIDVKKYASTIQVKKRLKMEEIEDPTSLDPEQDLENMFSAYECNICGKKFYYESQYQHHMKMHSNARKYVCEVCGASFIRKTYLDDHIEGHSMEKKHLCKFCGKAFKRRTVLRAHKRVHTHPNYYVCDQCGRGFTNSSTLKTHKLLIHVKSRNFLCVICNLTFPLKSTLNKHVMRHQKRENGEKGFNCTRCDMQYRDKSSLKRHVETKHEGRLELVACPECPKKYTSKANLKKHKRRHHNLIDNTETVAKEEIETESYE